MTENSGDVSKVDKEEKNSDINPAIKEEIKKMEDENKENIGENVIGAEKIIDKEHKKTPEKHIINDKETKNNEKIEEENKPNEGESKATEGDNKQNEESNKKDEDNKDESKKEEEVNKDENKTKEEENKNNEDNKGDNKDENKMKIEEEVKKSEEDKKDGDNKEGEKKEEEVNKEVDKKVEDNKDENKVEGDEAKKGEEENKDKAIEENKINEALLASNGIDIQNLLNSDKQNINELLEQLVQDKDFMSEFLKTEQQQNLLGKKTEREEKPENNNENNKDNTKTNENKNDLDKFDEFNMMNDFMLDDMGGHDHLLDDKEDKDKDKEDDDEEDFSYNRLLKLVKQYGINKMLKILVNILNKSDIVYKKVDDEIIKEEIIDIIKTIRKDVLFIYIMRIIANVSNNNNINNLSPLIPLLDNKKEPIVKKKIFKPMRLDHPERFDKLDNFDKNDINDKKDISSIGSNFKKQEGEVEYQYRWKHFHWKHGKLYCYAPKNKIRNSKCFLYCGKAGCDAKVQIDMVLKRALFIGNHYEHEGIDIEKYISEYPGIDTKDWKHLQYDCYHGKKILMWKY